MAFFFHIATVSILMEYDSSLIHLDPVVEFNKPFLWKICEYGGDDCLPGFYILILVSFSYGK